MNLDSDWKIKSIDRHFTIVGFCSLFEYVWKDNFVFDGESHDFWEIVFVKRGRVEVVEDENIYVLNQNDIIFHAPMEFHRIKNCPKTSSEVIVTSFKTVGMLPEVLKNGVFTLEHSEKDLLYKAVEQIRAFITDKPQYYAGQEAADLLSSFLLQLSKLVAVPSQIDSYSAHVYHNLVSDMTERVCCNLTLDDFAASNHISISYIKLLFQNYAGISPKAYYRRLRTLYAKRLLEEGDTIPEIVEKMNFSSPNYFSSFFKKQTGQSPSEYKASCRNPIL